MFLRAKNRDKNENKKTSCCILKLGCKVGNNKAKNDTARKKKKKERTN